ncbi:HTH-type transcriptional regulator BetI [compost metagenome]
MHQPSLHRLQRINDHRLYSNLCCEFRRVLPLHEARSAARGLAALIDGLWLRGALSGDAFDTDQALQIAYEYLDLQLAKQAGPGAHSQAAEQPPAKVARTKEASMRR